MYSGFGERDARPCVTRLRFVIFGRCPASALRCVVPGPLDDASGSFSLVMAFVNVNSAAASNCLWLTLCESFVRQNTGFIRVVCGCTTLCVR